MHRDNVPDAASLRAPEAVPDFVRGSLTVAALVGVLAGCAIVPGLERLHPDPFHSTSTSAMFQAISELKASIPTLNSRLPTSWPDETQRSPRSRAGASPHPADRRRSDPALLGAQRPEPAGRCHPVGDVLAGPVQVPVGHVELEHGKDRLVGQAPEQFLFSLEQREIVVLRWIA